MAAWAAGNTVQRESQLLAAPAEFSLSLLLFAEGSFYRASLAYIPSKMNICILFCFSLDRFVPPLARFMKSFNNGIVNIFISAISWPLAILLALP